MNQQNDRNTNRNSFPNRNNEFQSKGRSQRQGLESLDRLVELNKIELTRRPPQPQPEPLVFTGAVNAWYATVRNGQTSKIFLIEIRKDTALFKDHENDKHTQSISLAKFLKFYKAV